MADGLMRKAAPRRTPKRKAARVPTQAHGDKRLEIIERCADLFDSGGYHRATMQMLADEMGLGKPTLYHYFASKTDILYEMHQMHIDAMLEGLAVGQDLKELDPAQLLENACAFSLQQIAEHPGYVRAFMDHYSELEGRQRSEIRRRREEYLSRITQIVRAGIDKGRFQDIDPELATLAFLGMCNWAYKWYPRMADDKPPAKMAKELCRIFISGLDRR